MIYEYVTKFSKILTFVSDRYVLHYDKDKCNYFLDMSNVTNASQLKPSPCSGV